eukprot:TRINITY_DN13713_c0_g1_i1.p1 TRINITY_DN13713_c0_g1~~TRINITY_DN13713_c0_g1_i1.p1  ORF type:complete len:191 (+),score=33.38 TRINITY_DN13713_c0_g1_i1:3-575(+)
MNGQNIPLLAEKLEKETHLRVNRTWLEQCVTFLQENFNKQTRTGPLESYILEQFLYTDLNQIGLASLPSSVTTLHKSTLTGYCLLQIDEIINIAESIENRFSDTSNRFLKFSLTDGHQRVFAIEYRPIPALSANTPPGTKILIREVRVLRGLLLLTSGNVKVLGGSVEALGNIRRRLLESHKSLKERRAR